MTNGIHIKWVMYNFYNNSMFCLFPLQIVRTSRSSARKFCSTDLFCSTLELKFVQLKDLISRMGTVYSLLITDPLFQNYKP